MISQKKKIPTLHAVPVLTTLCQKLRKVMAKLTPSRNASVSKRKFTRGTHKKCRFSSGVSEAVKMLAGL